MLDPYWWSIDKAQYLSLWIDYLHQELPIMQIISWLGILLIGMLAWWMAKYYVKNC
jgi:hypothetical protein